MEHAGYVPEYVLRSSTRVQVQSTGKSTYVPVIGIVLSHFLVLRGTQVPVLCTIYGVLCTKIKWRYRSGVKSNSAQVESMICIIMRYCDESLLLTIFSNALPRVLPLFERLCCSYCPSNQHFRMIAVAKWKFTSMPHQAIKWRNSPTSVEQNLHLASVPDPGVVLTVHKPLVNCTVWSTYGARRVNYSVIRGWRRCPRGSTPYWWLSLSDYFFARVNTS